MPRMDVPHDRSLAASQDAPGESGGRARPPAELLGNLRLRLRQLPGNHPSAVRDHDTVGDAPRVREPAVAQGDRIKEPVFAKAREEPGDRPAYGPADGTQARGRRDDEPDAPAGEASAGTAADAGAPREASLTDLIRAAKNAGDALPAPAGDLAGTMDLFAGSGSGDPYRPWFMSGEPGMPWFAAGDET